MTGLLIAFEGIDGAGVSTHSRLLAEKLRRLGYSVLYTKEPTRSSPASGLLWRMLEEGGPPEVLALLFVLDRVYHLYYSGSDSVVAGVARGDIVVTDRYKYSSLAYQSAGGLPREWVRLVNEVAPPPHILVYIDVEPSVSLRRIKGRPKRHVFEEERFLVKVRSVFHSIVEELAGRPEYCGGDQVWKTIIEKAYGEQALGAWRGCIPAVVVVEGSRGGVDRSIDDVARDVYYGVVYAAVGSGLLEAPGEEYGLAVKHVTSSRTLRVVVHS
ncbi:MAG: dTMP kinase [Pyrodictiaceae archaeon]